MIDTLDSLSSTYKDTEPFLWAACEQACRNIGQPADADVWPALVEEVRKLVNEQMWKTKYFLILHILEQCVNNFIGSGRTALLNGYTPSSQRPALIPSTPAYNSQKRQEPSEDAISVVSDRSSTLPDLSPNSPFKNAGSLSDAAMWSFSRRDSILISCLEDCSYNNIIRSTVATKGGLKLDDLDEDDDAVIAKDSHIPWANSVSIIGKTLIEWRPAGCWRTISTEVYVTNHTDAPDMSAGKKLMNELAEHRKSLTDSISHILHHKRQKKPETPRLNHTNVTQTRFRTGAVRDDSFNLHESYTRSQLLSIPNNPRPVSTEMGRQQTSHSDSDLPPHLLQNQQYFPIDLPDHHKFQSSVPDLPLQSTPRLPTSSMPHPESLYQRGEPLTHRSHVPETVSQLLRAWMTQIPLLVIFWWILNMSNLRFPYK